MQILSELMSFSDFCKPLFTLLFSLFVWKSLMVLLLPGLACMFVSLMLWLLVMFTLVMRRLLTGVAFFFRGFIFRMFFLLWKLFSGFWSLSLCCIMGCWTKLSLTATLSMSLALFLFR